jgi:hypothetical protein
MSIVQPSWITQLNLTLSKIKTITDVISKRQISDDKKRVVEFLKIVLWLCSVLHALKCGRVLFPLDLTFAILHPEYYIVTSFTYNTLRYM